MVIDSDDTICKFGNLLLLNLIYVVVPFPFHTPTQQTTHKNLISTSFVFYVFLCVSRVNFSAIYERYGLDIPFVDDDNCYRTLSMLLLYFYFYYYYSPHLHKCHQSASMAHIDCRSH